MRYGLKDVVFAEPRGRTDAAVMFLGALIFSILYAYFEIFSNSSTFYVLIAASACAALGTAEAISKEKQRTAGVLRILGLFILFGIIAHSVLSPGLIIA